MSDPWRLYLQIINLGKRLAGFGTATLTIHWPKEISSGKWLLYLMKISATGVDQMQCTPKGIANPLGKVSGYTHQEEEKLCIDKILFNKTQKEVH